MDNNLDQLPVPKVFYPKSLLSPSTFRYQMNKAQYMVVQKRFSSQSRNFNRMKLPQLVQQSTNGSQLYTSNFAASQQQHLETTCVKLGYVSNNFGQIYGYQFNQEKSLKMLQQKYGRSRVKYLKPLNLIQGLNRTQSSINIQNISEIKNLSQFSQYQPKLLQQLPQSSSTAYLNPNPISQDQGRFGSAKTQPNKDSNNNIQNQPCAEMIHTVPSNNNDKDDNSVANPINTQPENPDNQKDSATTNKQITINEDYSDPEKLQKITKVQAFSRGYLARKSVKIQQGVVISVNSQQFPELVNKHDFSHPRKDSSNYLDRSNQSNKSKEMQEVKEEEADPSKDRQNSISKRYYDPDQLQKITKVQAFSRGYLTRKSVKIQKGGLVSLNPKQFPELVNKHDFQHPIKGNSNYQPDSDESDNDPDMHEVKEEEDVKDKINFPHLNEKQLQYEYNPEVSSDREQQSSGQKLSNLSSLAKLKTNGNPEQLNSDGKEQINESEIDQISDEDEIEVENQKKKVHLKHLADQPSVEEVQDHFNPNAKAKKKEEKYISHQQIEQQEEQIKEETEAELENQNSQPIIQEDKQNRNKQSENQVSSKNMQSEEQQQK